MPDGSFNLFYMAQKKTGVALLLGLAVTGASIAMLMAAPESTCTNRPSLAVLAMAAAFILALSYRLLRLASRGARSLLFAAMLLSAGTLIADVRYIVTHRTECAVS